MKITVVGAGAFGTSLAVSFASSTDDVTLLCRTEATASRLRETRENPKLPGVTLPGSLNVSHGTDVLKQADVILLAIPMQTLSKYLETAKDSVNGTPLVACCKGLDMQTLMGPTELIQRLTPASTPAVLTGPSFAIDIAQHLPTALTLACPDEDTGAWLQACLSPPHVRLYRTTDTTGAQLGGALKNVIAIACGVAIGAGLGESARAALIARGLAEMQSLAGRLGAEPATLQGLSGLGDLALTCTSEKSRNYRYGLALGAGEAWDDSTTTEGVATARAVSELSQKLGLEMPISQAVSDLVTGGAAVNTVMADLLRRPLKEE